LLKLKTYLVHLSILAVDCGNEKIVADVCQVTPEKKESFETEEGMRIRYDSKRNNNFFLKDE
jgi:hypothetical protein